MKKMQMKMICHKERCHGQESECEKDKGKGLKGPDMSAEGTSGLEVKY